MSRVLSARKMLNLVSPAFKRIVRTMERSRCWFELVKSVEGEKLCADATRSTRSQAVQRLLFLAALRALWRDDELCSERWQPSRVYVDRSHVPSSRPAWQLGDRSSGLNAG